MNILGRVSLAGFNSFGSCGDCIGNELISLFRVCCRGTNCANHKRMGTHPSMLGSSDGKLLHVLRQFQ
jgi:hypothetical protein